MNFEEGTFEVTTDGTNQITIEHGLGRVPKFAIAYPVEVEKTTSTFRTAAQLIFQNNGETNMNLSGSESTLYTTPEKPLAIMFTTNYNNTGMAANFTTNTFAVTESSVTFGNTTGGYLGTFPVGKFAYIVG